MGGQHFGVEDNFFDGVGGIGDDGCTPDFGTCAGGCGNGDDGMDVVMIGVCPEVADVFEVPNGFCLSHHEGESFPEIEAGSSPESDDAVKLPFAIEFESFF